MLSMMRGAVGGWVAKIFLFLLVASFGIYGISNSIFSGPGDSVLTVGDTRVSLQDYRLAYDRQINSISRSIGSQLTREQANAFGVEQSVLGNLISGAVLDESAQKMGLGISNDKLAGLIGDDETFRDASGSFSRLQLRQVLQSIGMSEDAYVQNRKSFAIRNQIIEGTAGNAELPEAFFDIYAASRAEKRIFDYVWIKPDDIKSISPPTDDALKAYYAENLVNYRAPEYRKLNIVKLEASDIMDATAISDAEIADEYEAKKTSYTEPEKRRIQQLVFADKAKAEAAVKSIREGESFETIMAEEGKTPSDIDLGLTEKSAIADTNIADAGFALTLNSTSDVIDGIFGSVVLRVIEIRPETVKPLTEVSGEIRKALALERASNEIFNTHDRLEDERAAGETLMQAAQNVGLQAQTIDAIDRTGRDPQGNIIKDLPESAKLIAEAFDSSEGVETDPISIGSDGFVWYEVENIIEERQKTFEEVKEQLSIDWTEAETDKAIAALAEDIRKKVVDGEAFDKVVLQLLAPTDATQPSRLLQSAALLQSDTSRDMDSNAVQAGFADKQDAVIVTNGVEGNGMLVMQIKEIQQGTNPGVDAEARKQVNSSLDNDLLSGLVTQLQQNLQVTVNQQAINAALSY